MKERLSNIELLRIVAMLFVLIVHSDFVALGTPSANDCMESGIASFTRIFLETLSYVCVNVFVLISGWFGIKPSKKGFCNFIFQCFFFLFSIYLVMVLLGRKTLSINGLADCLMLTESNWFIKSYICLYILAPILNAFTDTISQKIFRNTLLAFYIFQSVYGWLSHGAVFLVHGYSAMSFVGLYLLARYIRVYGSKCLNYPPHYYLVVYLAISLSLSIFSYIFNLFGVDVVNALIYSYINPLMVLSALALLIFFSKLNFKNRIVNKIALSCFAIFLLHANPNILNASFAEFIRYIYENNNVIVVLIYIMFFLVTISIVAIIVDQVRIFVWLKISRILFK